MVIRITKEDSTFKINTISVPAILSGPVDTTLEYSDDLTATFSCTAFGGNNSVLVLSWTHSAGANLNADTENTTVSPDDSYTSTITTDTLTLDDRGSEYTCEVEYDGSASVNEATATLSIGKEIYRVYCYGIDVCIFPYCSTYNFGGSTKYSGWSWAGGKCQLHLHSLWWTSGHIPFPSLHMEWSYGW